MRAGNPSTTSLVELDEIEKIFNSSARNPLTLVCGWIAYIFISKLIMRVELGYSTLESNQNSDNFLSK